MTQKITLQRMALHIRLLTNKSPKEAYEVIFKLSEWTRDKNITLESAFELYINDIKQYGEPNIYRIYWRGI